MLHFPPSIEVERLMTTFQNYENQGMAARPERLKPFISELSFKGFTGTFIRGDNAACEFEFSFPNQRSLFVYVSDVGDSLVYSPMEGRGISLSIDKPLTTHTGQWPLCLDFREYDVDALFEKLLGDISRLAPESKTQAKKLASAAGESHPMKTRETVVLSYRPDLRKAYRLESFLEICREKEESLAEAAELISAIPLIRSGEVEFTAASQKRDLSFITPSLYREICRQALSHCLPQESIELAQELNLESGFIKQLRKLER